MPGTRIYPGRLLGLMFFCDEEVVTIFGLLSIDKLFIFIVKDESA